MEIGPFAGLIYTVILIVDCLFFLILEWSMPREDFDFAQMHWDHEYFVEVCNDLYKSGLVSFISLRIACPEERETNIFTTECGIRTPGSNIRIIAATYKTSACRVLTFSHAQEFCQQE